MLNLGAYIPSNEDYDDAIPSPLVDGDNPVIGVTPVDDLGDVQVVEELGGAPIEETVQLPPTLDPAPLQPLEAEIVQEEVIAADANAEAGQLMGAQIALEGYGKLLRSAGGNMTRQSAAFMAVGMARAHRLLGTTTLGLEDESSGTQVMAMQKAKVDEKGLGSKIKELAARFWEWLKEKGRQLIAFFQKLRGGKEATKKQVTYLIAASEVVESGNKTKVAQLEAPSGIKVAQVLDAIHGEDVRAPAKSTGKRVKLPAALVPYITRGGKLDLDLSVENEVRSQFFLSYLKDATVFLKGVSQIFANANKGISAEEMSDGVSDLMRKHLAGKPGSWEMHGMKVERSDDGTIVVNKTENPEEVEVEVPTPQVIRKYLQDIDSVLDKEIAEGTNVAEQYQKAQEEMMKAGERLDGLIDQAEATKFVQNLSKVFKNNSFEDQLRDVANWMDRISTAGVKACDFFLSHLLGKGNTISQEDYLALPGPSGPGLGARIANGAKEMWRKIKEFFARLWQQGLDLWAKVKGWFTNDLANTETLLLVNNYVPDENETAPSGPPPALPPGTGLKSIAAARGIDNPAAEPPAPGQPATPVVEEPVGVNTGPVEVSMPEIRNGFVAMPELSKLEVNGTPVMAPVVEQKWVDWLLRSGNPEYLKLMRDLTSYVQSGIDPVSSNWREVVNGLYAKCCASAPFGEYPGGFEILKSPKGPGVAFRANAPKTDLTVKILNKRAIDAALSQQRKVLTALDNADSFFTEFNSLRAKFEQAIDRLIDSAESDEVAQAYADIFADVNRRTANSAYNLMSIKIHTSCSARTAVLDVMIAARAKGKRRR